MQTQSGLHNFPYLIQIVRGLSVENVTGPMGNIDMAPILQVNEVS